MSPVCLTVCDCGVFLGTCADARSECGKASIPSCRYATHVTCSLWYVLVEFVWDIAGHILFSGVYTELYIGDSLFVVL